MKRLLIALLFVAAPLVHAETRVPQSQAEISLGFAPLVKEAAPAVVNIYAKIVRQAPQRSPFMSDPFFDEFFRGLTRPKPRVQNSLGSGVILSADGIVVSNYHVVGTATDIRVVTNDRREYTAHVVLGDKASDLAILQLDEAEDLPFLDLRNSDQVEVGELVLAIGNPFGVGQTVSSGIVSGLARSGTGSGGGLGYFIQTDAPINPGNSGGALVDVNGDLIGINTRILSRSGGSNGIGFAIPANLVAAFVAQARDGVDSFQRPWAGMVGQPVDADLAETLGLNLPEGMVISDLHEASPFAAAGFLIGDVITHVDGEPVNSPSEMVFRMTVAGLGGVSEVRRVRNGVSEVVEVALLLAPDEPESEPLELGKRSLLPGLTVANINPAVTMRMQLPLSARGIVVLETGQNGARIGLQRGDILRAIDGREIRETDDVPTALERSGRRIDILLERRGQRLNLRFRT